MYQALYRKWRPRVFADVIGQSHVTRTLRRQVAEGRTSHAYLFTGTRGTGKTTCAKILARAVNCEHPRDGDPCCECPSCIGLENGTFLDVLELDAASNNGVDQVRALRDEAIYAPANVKQRVYIVDEVHMLSTPAFNALLKILEEPPEHLMFILATTELHKVPATILSRCQRYAFRRIQPGDIQARLLYVSEREGLSLTEDGAELLSRLADGAMRDGLSLLDQCAATGGTIDSAAVLDVLGLAGRLRTAELLERILQRDADGALHLFGTLYEGGKDPGTVLGELSALVRDLLLGKAAPESGAALLSGGYDGGTLERLGRNVTGSRLLYLASGLQKAGAELYASPNRRLDAELCILRLCDESLSGDPAALISRIERLEEQIERGGLPQRMPPSAGAAQKKPPSGPWDPKPEKRAQASGQDAPPEMAPPPWGDADAPPEMAPPPWGDADAPPEMAPPPWDDADAPPEAFSETARSGGGVPETAPQAERFPDAAPERFPDRRPDPGGVPDAPPQTDGAPEGGASAPAVRTDAAWWPDLLERCKPQFPVFLRPFLSKCGGVLEGDLLTVYAPDSLTLGRIGNSDKVRDTLIREAGGAIRVVFREGVPPARSPEENLRQLAASCRQYDVMTVKGEI